MLLAVRTLRFFGWLIFVASGGVVVAVTLIEIVQGPIAGVTLWPAARALRLMTTSVAMAAAATAVALVLALPAAIALALTSRRSQWRAVILSLTLLPLITLPAVFAYSWILIMTSRFQLVASIVEWLGLNNPNRLTVQSAFILALWLWPIPAFILVASFRHAGRGAYQLASLDARPVRAFLSAALPAMRSPLLASMAIIFILALIDSTIVPLMNASDCWAVEMLAQASVAARFDRPVAYIFWQAWPILAVVALAALAAMPGLMRMAAWSHEPETADAGSHLQAPRAITFFATMTAAILAILPILVFSLELASGRYSVSQAVSSAWYTLRTAGFASILVSILTAAAVIALALLTIETAASTRTQPILSRAVLALLLVTAVLPPEITGTALVSFYTRICDPRDWNFYDNTPAAWVGAMVARFGFIAAVAVWLAARHQPREILDAARTDGADRLRCLAHVQLPFLWPSLAAAAIVTACLTFSEVGASVFVQPSRFFGGSLAVAIDSQMHYGRQDVTIAASLMMMIPAFVVAALAPAIYRRTMK